VNTRRHSSRSRRVQLGTRGNVRVRAPRGASPRSCAASLPRARDLGHCHRRTGGRIVEVRPSNQQVAPDRGEHHGDNHHYPNEVPNPIRGTLA